MQRIICVLAMVYIVMDTQGQSIGKVNTGRPSRWSIGLMGSPDYGGRLYKAETGRSFDGMGVGNSTAQNIVLAALLKSNERKGLSYTGGVHVQYDLSKRWFARLGLYYSNKMVRTTQAVSSFDSLPGYALVPAVSTRSNFPFLDIPLTFHYMLNKPFDKNKKGTCYTDYSQYNRKKPLFYVFLGPVYSTNLSTYNFVGRKYSNNGVVTNTVYVGPYTLKHAGLYGGGGMIKYLNQRWFMTIEATGRYMPARWYAKNFDYEINAQTQQHTALSYHVVDKPWAVALQIGINYHF